MTRYYWNKKDTVEECRDIGISWLKEHGYFCGYRSGTVVWKSSDDEEVGSIGIDVSVMDGDNYARFHYTITELSTGEKTKYDYKVTLTTTPCHFGGVRYWFICPLSKNGVYCGRRVAKLYRAPNADYYGCRHCYNLSYESRNQARSGMFGHLRHLIRAEEQCEKLSSETKRWTYRGRLTKKARKLLALQQSLMRSASMSEALLDKKQ